MSPDQKDLMWKARTGLKAARVMLEEGFPGFAASRAYYTMFYIAEALLEGEGMAFSKHSAVIAAFGKHFAQTGRVPAEFHRWLIKAQIARIQGDYNAPETVSLEEARLQVERAEQFFRMAVELLGPVPDENDE